MPTTWTNPESVAVEIKDDTIEVAEARIRVFENPARVTASQTYAVVEVFEGEGNQRNKKLHVFPYTSVMSLIVVEKAEE